MPGFHGPWTTRVPAISNKRACLHYPLCSHLPPLPVILFHSLW